MKVDTLTPNEYWDTSVLDYELALTVQRVCHEGREEGIREAQDAQREKREYERKEAESAKRVAEQMGRF